MTEKRKDRPVWIRYSGLGVEFAAAVGGLAAVGAWIDHHFDTWPWALVICAVLGVVGGAYNFIRGGHACI